MEGPPRHPDALQKDFATLSALRQRTHAPEAVRESRESREELLRLVRTGGVEQIRRVLSLLAERSGDSGFDELLTESLAHPEPRVRLHAHRLSRRVLSREAYLERTALLLDDRQSDIVPSAVRTLGHAALKPAIPSMVALLTHPNPSVRRAAADGLVLLGTDAIPALRHTAGRARPDRRRLYEAVLERITTPAVT